MRLVIHADDFGLSEGVNRGILEAHEAGTVTSTSLMANTPGCDDAIRLARSTPTLDVGLHFNLTAGRPLTPISDVRSLVDERTGRFHGLAALVARALAGKIVHEEVAVECRAQLARVRDAGVRVTHVDSHHHVHALAAVWRPLVAACKDAGIGVMRRPLEPLDVRRPRMAVAQALFHISHRAAVRRCPPLRHADHFRGFSLTGADDFLGRLLRCIDTLEPGSTELMVHPGRRDATLAEWARLSATRERELEALTSPALRARLSASDIELVGFGSL